MAIPRIFVSSTCYDLQEVRFQLRHFISEFGFDPVMSEFGDIFFDLKLHVQDACKNEIEKTDLFILIIGNSYGSIYHKHQNHLNPDSVTLQEFRKCLEVGIPKYIFINKFLKHDFDNYKRTKAQAYAKNFEKSETEMSEAEFTEIYNKSYPFPQESYRYIFQFLQIASALETNNATYAFESFDEIKSCLKKQWAALFYEALVNVKATNQFSLADIERKLSKIENHIEIIAKSQKKPSQSREPKPSALLEEINKEENIDLKEKLHNCLDSFFFDKRNSRLKAVKRPFDKNSMVELVNNIEKLIKKYKLSKTIPINEAIQTLPNFEYYSDYTQIPHETLDQLIKIKNQLAKDDEEAFYMEILRRFNQISDMRDDDEIPF